MPVNAKKLAAFSPTTSELRYYTVPANTATIITNILISNTASTPLALFLSFVTVGGFPGPTNRIVPGTTIGANQLVPIDAAAVLAAGDYISALAGGAGLVVYISGTEQAAASAVTAGSVIKGTRLYRTRLYARSYFL